jgi:hypothetical protein
MLKSNMFLILFSISFGLTSQLFATTVIDPSTDGDVMQYQQLACESNLGVNAFRVNCSLPKFSDCVNETKRNLPQDTLIKQVDFEQMVKDKCLEAVSSSK